MFDLLPSSGLSRVFSNTIVQKHQLFGTQPSYGPTLTSKHDYWKTIGLTVQTFVGKVMFLVFNMLSSNSWYYSKNRIPLSNKIARRSNQSILKEISPEYSLEGLILKLKLQYCGLLMRRTDSFEKTLMLGKIEGGRRRDDRG